MADEVRGKTYFVELTHGEDTIKYAFNTGAEYEGDVAEALGVQVPDETAKGLLFGLNDPKPRKVTIRYYEDDTAKQYKATRTVSRFVSDEKASAGGLSALKGKKMKVWVGRELKEVEIASAAIRKSRR